MQVFVHLDELLTPALLQQHQRHIVDFLEMEGIAPEAEVGRTKVSERAAKELLAELAHDLDQTPEDQ
ncbi:hypothetical protein [Herpetosiphon sp. NSE202]|uniref:hypothetical protein n=1 Tax=Herpetosiphon sp. NSE202 TaxID=3351349 RepID=UPI00362F872D